MQLHLLHRRITLPYAFGNMAFCCFQPSRDLTDAAVVKGTILFHDPASVPPLPGVHHFTPSPLPSQLNKRFRNPELWRCFSSLLFVLLLISLSKPSCTYQPASPGEIAAPLYRLLTPSPWLLLTRGWAWCLWCLFTSRYAGGKRAAVRLETRQWFALWEEAVSLDFLKQSFQMVVACVPELDGTKTFTLQANHTGIIMHRLWFLWLRLYQNVCGEIFTVCNKNKTNCNSQNVEIFLLWLIFMWESLKEQAVIILSSVTALPFGRDIIILMQCISWCHYLQNNK